MNIVNDLEGFLNENNIAFLQNYDLKSNCYSKTGYLVKQFILPKTIQEFVLLIQVFNASNIDYKIVGETTNVLFLDTVIYSNIISTKLLTAIEFRENEVSVTCGKNLPDFVRELAMRNYAGFEGLEGIPGTVGGAVFMNAGAYGYEISDNIKSVTFIDLKGELKTFNKDKLKFKRRSSFFKENADYIIVSILFEIELGNQEDIYRKIEKFHIARHKYQEWVYPNLGSIYSSKRSIYDSSSRCNKYKLKLKFIRRFFYNNPIARHYNRKTPSNKKLNDLFISHFKLCKFEKIISKKNLNTFINKNNTTLEIVSYISELGSFLDDDTYLENELVNKAIFEVTNVSDMQLTIKLNERALRKN